MSSEDVEMHWIPKAVIFFVHTKEEKDKLVYHHICDDLSPNEIREAKIFLFVGQKYTGKTTAINAFFNIVKGINFKSPERFILINEPEEQNNKKYTSGIHLYYLKDSDKNPLIIIDSEGYGFQTYAKDLEINKAFEFVFRDVINHINIICLTEYFTNIRFTLFMKYIYQAVTGLFADDIKDNFIVFLTHSYHCGDMKNPHVIENIIMNSGDLEFLKSQNM